MTHNDHIPAYVYGRIEETYHTDTGYRVAYGIAAYAHPTDTESATIVASVRDVTQNRAAMDELIRQCNAGGLSPAHLQDVIEDRFGT